MIPQASDGMPMVIFAEIPFGFIINEKKYN